jgi:predicted DNA-binding transcriptional regulator AlpA
MEQLKTDIDPLLTEKEVAMILKISVKTARRYRSCKSGPPYVKLGTLVRYPYSKLQEWIQSYPVHGGE